MASRGLFLDNYNRQIIAKEISLSRYRRMQCYKIEVLFKRFEKFLSNRQWWMDDKAKMNRVPSQCLESTMPRQQMG